MLGWILWRDISFEFIFFILHLCWEIVKFLTVFQISFSSNSFLQSFGSDRIRIHNNNAAWWYFSSPKLTSAIDSAIGVYNTGSLQRCGTLTIFPVPVPTFEKLWFRFLLYFWKVLVSVPVPTFEKLWFRFQPHIKTIKSKFFKKFWNFFLPFYLVSCFTRNKFINYNK